MLFYSTFLNFYIKLVSLPLLLTSFLKMFVTGVWVYFLVQGSPLSESMIWKCWGCYELAPSFHQRVGGYLQVSRAACFTFSWVKYEDITIPDSQKWYYYFTSFKLCKRKRKLRQILTKTDYVKSPDKRPGHLVNFENFRGGNPWNESFMKFLIERAP